MTSHNVRQTNQLLHQFKSLHQELIDFVSTCSDKNWQKHTGAERWSIASTAHHVGIAHYGRIAWVEKIAAGLPLPKMTGSQVDEENAQNALLHANDSQEAVLAYLQNESRRVIATLKSLSDEQLAQTAYLEIIRGEVSGAQLVANVVIGASIAHLASMKSTANGNQNVST